jgi:glycosyltransferase involved in cell wall biosynthesis
MQRTQREATDARRPVLVYRDRIGVASEIEFLRRQYLGFRTLRPVWIGRTVTSGADRLDAPRICFGGVRGLMFRHFGVPPALDFSRFAPVVHAQFARGGALALPLARAMNARLVVTLHGGDVGKDKNWRRTVLARRWPEVVAQTYRFICVSHAVAETAVRRGVPDRLLTVLPIGVEIPAALPEPRSTGALLFAGRFVEKKGVVVLAEAMRRLRAGGDMTRLICAGDGPLRPVLEQLAQDIPGVELVGWLSPANLAERMGTALALVVPSVVAADGDAEGLPSVVPEAMARGCVVIGSDQGGIAEAVSNETTGLLVAAGDAAALAAVMRRVTARPDLAARLAQAAFRDVAERFDAVRQSVVLETILLAAAEQR